MTANRSLRRRDFLQRGALAAAAGGAPLALQLAAMGEAAAQSATSGYKALVCIFLYGGNDALNTVVPCDPGQFALYEEARPEAAWTRDQLLPLWPLNPLASARQLAMPGTADGAVMKPLVDLFHQQRLAVVLNVGPLAQAGVTASNWTSDAVQLPPKLFSHNDQQSLWQSMQPEGQTSGWGGRLGDALMGANGQQPSFTCVSASGRAVYLSGRQALQYFVGPQGALLPESQAFGSSRVSDAMKRIATHAALPHWLAMEHALIMQRALTAGAAFNQAVPDASTLTTAFDAGNPLAMQLLAVARAIGAGQALGLGRQVFFVSLGGFNTHDNQKARQGRLLARVAQAMKSFHDATVELGLAQQVTTFTASEFGRTLRCNGDGTDHGWGGHHLVMGGAVNGRRLFGSAPVLRRAADGSIGFGPQDAGQGRLIPTTSVDQLGVRLGRWLGVPEATLTSPGSGIFPGAGAFNQTALNGLLA